jgi:multisubunit Na+/H+ antiporter MnhB subunit
MLALPLILVVALALDLARQPRGTRRARIRARPRSLWVLLLAGLVGLLAAFAADQSLTGYPILTYPVTFEQALTATGQHAVTAINLFAFVPIATAAALMARTSSRQFASVNPGEAVQARLCTMSTVRAE